MPLARHAIASAVPRIALLATVTLAAVVPAPPAAAKPLPTEQQIPVDVRRVTLVVRDVDRSLAVYRDALGLRVVYDQLIGGGTGADGRPTPPTIRLVLLRANDDFVGLIGLMQRLDDTPPPPPDPPGRARAGQPILVINAKDLETRFPKLAATPGVTVSRAPMPVEYPAPGGGTIPVLFSAIWDPDGFFVELNQLLGTPAGTESKPKNTASASR
jgi:catechol 2,3-dioxygenase-like lactoylglutathione lyase family enzyme